MSEIWNLSCICRFCHTDGNFRTFNLPFILNGKIETFKDMLENTFNISMTIPSIVNASNMICESCISSLTEAAKFKQQVLACEDKFHQYIKNEVFTLGVGNYVANSEDVKIQAVECSKSVIKNEVIETPDVKDEYKSDSEETNFKKVEVEIKLKFEENESLDEDCHYDDNFTTEKNIIAPDTNPQRPSNVVKKNKKVLLNKKPTNKKIQKYSIKRNKSIRNYTTCRVCFKNISSGEFPNHVERHKIPHSCKYCKKKFDLYSSIDAHIQKDHGNHITYTCNWCKRSYNTQAKLCKHLDTHTRTNVFQCDICQRKFKCRTTIIRHIRTHDPLRADKRYECPHCMWRFANRSNLFAHVQTVHKLIKNYHCTMCSKSFAAKKNLGIHLKTHSNERPFKCEICKKKFKDSSYLNQHKKSQHQIPKSTLNSSNPKSYICTICEMKFDHRGIYRDHLQTHPLENPVVCDQCGMLFSSLFSLKRHSLTHAKSYKVFTCDLCNKTYKTKLQLQRHIKRIHLQIFEKSKCEVCGKYVVHLKQHQRIHNNRRFMCTMCDSTFSERNAFKRHLRNVHAGYKLYRCEVCGKRYVNKKSLQRHNQIKCKIY